MNPQAKQVIVRPTSTESAREYHLEGDGIKLTASGQPYQPFWHPMYDSGAQFEGLSPIGKQIADRIMGKGFEKSISRITFRPESVKVYKAPTADWTTVEEDIVLPSLKEVFGENLQPVQFGTTKQRELVLA
ncbi:hypothetical protein H0X09_01490 [Candidatus Saccharibacteria bacterium]|nr:hypothetical protein [Candidatus Saccharibacteria bacterium]